MKRSEFIKSALAISAVPSLYGFKNTEVNFNSLKDESWDSIRKQFLIDKKITYLNNGTIGISPKLVVEELNAQYTKQARNGSYAGVIEMNLIKTRLGNLIGAEEKSLAITKNVTEGINIACWGQTLKKEDEVIMTTHEHVGGCAAWLYRSKQEGIKIKTFELGNTAEETFENLKKQVTDKTKIIAVPHIPCTIGQILPIKEICEFARSKNIISIIDGAHPIGMIRFNLKELGCDYYSGCLHKWLLGPVGLGFIYIKPELLDKTNIYNLGAYSIDKFDMTASPPSFGKIEDYAQRFSTGTFCGPNYLAAVKAIDWYEGIGVDRIEKRVKELSFITHQELSKFKDQIDVLSPVEDRSRGAQTCFQFKNKKAGLFVNYARIKKIYLRHIHEGNRDDVRISTHYYNSEKQIKSLMEAISNYLKN